MDLLDKILGLAVIWLPLALSVAFIFVPARSEDERRHMKWRLWLVVFAFCFGLLAWWQQTRAIRAASKDRESAIKETSTRVSADVTRAVTSQYAGMIAEQQKKIDALQAQLTVQGKDVATIKGSNIVTGKKPIRVEVTNPTNADASGLPSLNWTQDEAPPENGHARKTVHFKTDGALNLAAFIAVCDRPCKSISGGTIGPPSNAVYLSAESNVAGILFNLPRPLAAGIQCLMVLESADDKPIKVMSFRILRDSEIPLALK